MTAPTPTILETRSDAGRITTGIATVSLSGLLADKLDAIAGAGFDGVEIFDNDLVASPLPPAEVAMRCADLGLTIDLFQPLRDVQGVPPGRFPAVLHRVRTKLEVMAELGATRVLACSSVAADSSPDIDQTAEQLHAVGALAAEYGGTVAFEALAWGRHVNRVGQAWEAVVRAGHPAVTLAVDTFHMLARGDDGAALAGIPGDRIGFLQVADAPLLDMGLLEWSRHHRCFPGQGTLDVPGVVAAALTAGYRGPVSLEVFSDVVRQVDPDVTARDAKRSLVFLEDLLSRRLPARERFLVHAAPPASSRTDAAFVEIADPDGLVAVLVGRLGFARVGTHRSKPVDRWANGEAQLVLNRAPAAETATTALGIVAAPVTAVAARARTLLWPAVDRTRGDDEALLPGVTLPGGLHLFVSDEPGQADDWRTDFVGDPGSGDDQPPDESHGWTGIDHVGIAVAPDDVNEIVSFFRSVLGLSPGPVEEFIEPHGRLLSRALRPAAGDLRVVLNVADRATMAPVGVTQLAFRCDDVVREVAALRGRGVPMMPVPDNYYVDLQARFALDPDTLDTLRRHGVLYDRTGSGELLHAYTQVLDGGFHVELLERRGGYDGYGAASTHVRLAMQAAHEQRAPTHHLR